MAQVTTGWRSILSMPAVYRSVQTMVGSAHARKILMDEYLQCEPGHDVIDIGCGTGDLAPHLVGCRYVGYDLSEAYIDAARSKHGEYGEFRVGVVGATRDPSEQFDRAIAKGVLHHLDDDQARALFEEAHAALRDGGRLITVDPCFTDDQSMIARAIISRDRGQNVRTVEEVQGIARSVFGDVKYVSRSDLLHVPYTHAIGVCTKRTPLAD